MNNAFKVFKDSIDYDISEGSIVLRQQIFLEKFLLQHEEIRYIAETGFNGGISSACMLSTRKDIKVISFDICSHDYCINAKNLIDKQFPNRHILITGDSLQSIATLKSIFKDDYPIDFLFIDGSHIHPHPQSDLTNLLEYLKPKHYLVMDDYCKFYGKEGVIDAWHKMVDEKKIMQIGKPYYILDRGFVLGRKL